MKIDVHQHLWTEPLVQALAERSEFPFVRREHGLMVLYLADERPYVIDLRSERPEQRAALVDGDGLDRALVCLSSPLGIEWLPREQASRLIGAYHDGALSLPEPFGVWAAIALDRTDPDDIDRALTRGCVGVSLPAGALAGVEAVTALAPLLARLELRGAPLLVHPGPRMGRVGAGRSGRATSLEEPLWWPALTCYVAGMQAAWLAFLAAGRPRHPRLRVVFSMLAGLAPLQLERLASRGGPRPSLPDPLTFYETSSYGPATVRLLGLVGPEQLLYGSDRPVVEPADLGMPEGIAWGPTAEGTRRALGGARTATVAAVPV